MASIINVDQIRNAAGTNGLTLDASTGKASFPNGATLPAGSVAQVVSNVTTANISTASISFVSTGLSASITPSSTSSKVFVIVSSPSWYIDTNNAYATVFRDSTNIGNGDYGLMMVYNTANYAPSTMQVMDSPSSTSSLTYSVHFRAVTSGATTYISYSTYGQFTITLMEIAQ
tara:strand:+ start:18 stop:536 length:519 start_codon:yes stop_codon:yes gene_type:complete